MGAKDSLLQVGLHQLFGVGTRQDAGAAYDSFKAVAGSGPEEVCQLFREYALFWLAVMNLLGLGKDKRSVAKARKMLETTNIDDDHEQANEILNIIGKSQYIRRRKKS